MVVFGFPIADHDLGVQERIEAVDVQALVANPAVERFDVAVAPRRPGRDIAETGASTGPPGHRLADELGIVVAPQHRRGVPACDEVVEMGGESIGGDGAFHEAADAFAGVFIDDGADFDRPATLIAVELEIDRLHHVRCYRGWRVTGGGTDAFAAATLRDA